MRRIRLIFSLACLGAFGAMACSDNDEARLAVSEDAPRGQVAIMGCLTGAPDGGAFVLTADRTALASGPLTATTGEVPTYTYELVGGTDLSRHTGRQVSVTGRLDDDAAQEVDIDAEEKTKLPPTQRGNETVTPAIETREEVEIQVRRLHVSSVTPTGAPCK